MKKLTSIWSPVFCFSIPFSHTDFCLQGFPLTFSHKQEIIKS